MNRELNLSVTIAGMKWKNPVGTASGTFSVKDSGAFYDMNLLGAVTAKGVAAVPWEGNPTPRIAESYGGMLNSVGLQNPGVDAFLRDDMPLLEQLNTQIIANLAGHSSEEYQAVAERLTEVPGIHGLELNISCPNVKAGGIAFGTDAEVAAKVTREVRRVVTKPLIVKLTPNVTDICEIAKAVEAEGADVVSLVNTFLGMRIDVKERKPILASVTGGLSGPAIKPIALRMVYQVRKAICLPIIGLGGIATGQDAAEFLMAGADAVEVGSAALMNPTAPVDVLSQLVLFMAENGFSSVKEIRDAFLEQGRKEGF